MKALQLQPGEPSGRLALVDVPTPQPAAHQVRIRVAYAGINNIDRLVVEGLLPQGPKPPWIPGLELSGTVEAVGSEVTGLSVGQRVAYMGTLEAAAYAEHVLAEARYVVPLPEGLGLQAAAALLVNGVTALTLLEDQGRARAGEVALVYGAAGGVGTALLQLARLRGVRTLALVGRADKADYVRAQGAEAVVLRHGEEVAERVRSLTGGRGLDLSFNMAGGDTVARDVTLLAPFGRVVVFGFESGPLPAGLGPALTASFNRSPSVHLSDLFTFYLHAPERYLALAREVFHLAAAGQLTARVDQVLPLSQGRQALDRIASGQVLGKLLLDCQKH